MHSLKDMRSENNTENEGPYSSFVTLDSVNSHSSLNNISWDKLNKSDNEDDTISMDVESGDHSDVDRDNVSTPSGDMADVVDFWEETKKLEDKKDEDNSISSYLVEKITKYTKDPKDTFIINMISIKRIPDIMKTFTKLIHLEIKDAGIVELTVLPPNVVKVSLAKNNIVMISKGVFPNSTKQIDLSKNQLINLDFVEDNVEILNVSFNKIPALSGNLSGLVKLDITSVGLRTFDNMNILPKLICLSASKNDKIMNIDCLKEKTPNLNILETCSCGFEKVSKLPERLTKWISNNGQLEELTFDEFPDSLEDLDLFNNFLSSCPPIRKNLVTIDLMDNKLKTLMEYHDEIDNMDLRDNEDLNLTDEEKRRMDEINAKEEKILFGKDEDTDEEDHFAGFSSSGRSVGGNVMYDQWIRNLQNQQRSNNGYSSHHGPTYNFTNNQFLVQQRKKMQAGLGPRIVHKNSYTL